MCATLAQSLQKTKIKIKNEPLCVWNQVMKCEKPRVLKLVQNQETITSHLLQNTKPKFLQDTLASSASDSHQCETLIPISCEGGSGLCSEPNMCHLPLSALGHCCLFFIP